MLLAEATGRVLEIGGGTGANLAHYGPGVESLTITEPEIPMLQAPGAQGPRRSAGDSWCCEPPPRTCHSRTDRFDTVVSTLVLCGVDDQPRALREIRRVLRPGGSLLFLEHVRSTDAKLARKQDRMNGINRFVVVLRLQPADPRHDERGRLHCDLHGAHQHAESADLRAPRHRRDRKSPATVAAGVDGTFAAGQ